MTELLKVLEKLNPKVGEVWPAGQWVYIKPVMWWIDKTKEGRWFFTTGEPTNEDGSAWRREDDEISESEANAMGIFRDDATRENHAKALEGFCQADQAKLNQSKE